MQTHWNQTTLFLQDQHLVRGWIWNAESRPWTRARSDSNRPWRRDGSQVALSIKARCCIFRRLLLFANQVFLAKVGCIRWTAPKGLFWRLAWKIQQHGQRIRTRSPTPFNPKWILAPKLFLAETETESAVRQRLRDRATSSLESLHLLVRKVLRLA